MPPHCPDCSAEATGQPHADRCDVAVCLVTGLQRLSCEHDHDHGRDVWTGTVRALADAVALGWFARMVPHRGWVACDPGPPDAVPDLNRLYADAVWDPQTLHWRPRTTEGGDPWP